MLFQELGVVVSSDKQITGVALTDNGRMFFSMPTFIQKDNYNIGELVDGEVKQLKIVPFTCVTSVMSDKNDLYIVDEKKLVVYDTDKNKLIKSYNLSLIEGSKLNDIRLVGRTALISEYGKGSIVVLDLSTGKSRQVLLSSNKTKAQKTTAIVYGNKISGTINVDAIEVSPDNKTFYFSFPLGGNLWSVSVDALLNPSLTAARLDSQIKKGPELPVLGGLRVLPNGSFLLSNAGLCSIDILRNGKIEPFIKPHRLLQWPDALTVKNGWVYFACSQLDSSSLLNPSETDETRAPFNVLRVRLPLTMESN